jgi:fucokinase
MTEDTSFSSLYTAQQRLGSVSPPGVSSAGVIVDSVFAEGGEVGAGSVVIECDFAKSVRVGRNAIIHGLTSLPARIVIPDDTVVHQAPVRLPDGRKGVAIRAYGVQDDPKLTLPSGGSTWFGRPILEVLSELELDPNLVWADVPADERCLWSARLFSFGAAQDAWDCASWLMRLGSSYSRERWLASERLSLADSAQWADGRALLDARSHRLQASWQLTAVALAESGSDIRPMLARSPGLAALKRSGRALSRRGEELAVSNPTEAASRYFQSSLFLVQAGLETEAADSRSAAFRCVRRAVEAGCPDAAEFAPQAWVSNRVRVAGPARIDLGGGWSDTPPFCLDWGGAVLNVAVALNGEHPITATLARLEQPVIRCVSIGVGETIEFQSTQEITGPLSPGSTVAIPRAALQLLGIVRPNVSLPTRLRALGGGLEIQTQVDLPMGSGLGTSSILAAALLRGLAEIAGLEISDTSLSDQVMRLEQLMTTGGGWQDQAGGIFPGAKLVTTGPGLRQRLRVQPLAWTEGRQQEFADRFVLYYTGIRRIAKNLLAQVVGSYLSREVATLQVLHSIKTLAVEMSYAMNQGEWDYLGSLLDRHWQLNQVLDPHTTNAPIDSLLRDIRPHLAGAKLAGAGGGGFLMLLAKSPEQAQELRRELERRDTHSAGAVYDYRILNQGLSVERE